MEIFRALAVLVESFTGSEVVRLRKLLGFDRMPLASEHTETFVFQFYPYASVYLSTEGMLGGEARDRIAGFWRALGQTPPTEPDHLAIMLEAYARLSSPEHMNSVVSSSEDLNVITGSLLHTGIAKNARRHEAEQSARKAFLWEHLDRKSTRLNSSHIPLS